MLDSLRSWAGTWVAAVFIFLLAGSFAVFGVGDILRGGQNNTVATVGNLTITVPEFRREFQRELNRMSNDSDRVITIEEARAQGLDYSVAQRMVARTAVDALVGELALATPDDAVASKIRGNRNFAGLDGNFDRVSFQLILNQNGLTEQEYSDSVRGDLTRQQIMQAVTTGIVAPKVLATNLFSYLQETRDVEYLAVMPDKVAPPVEPDDESIATFYAENQALFMAPEYRAVTVLSASPEDLLGRTEVRDDELQTAYEEQIDRFRTPAKRTVDQILFPDEAAARTGAETLRTTDDFGQAVADLGFNLKDVNLGEIEIEALPAGPAEAVFALEEGQISDPLESAFGWAVYRATGLKPEITQPFEDVVGVLRRDIGLDRARDELYDLQNAIEDQRATGAPLQDVAAELDLKIVREEAVDPRGFRPDGGRAEGLFRDAEVMSQIFSIDPADEQPLQETSDGAAYVLRIDGITVAAQRPLTEVRASIVEILKADQQREALEARTDEIIASLQETTTLEQAAQTLETEVRKAEGLKRNAGDGAVDGELLEMVFKAGESTFIAGPSSNSPDRLVVRITRITPPDPSEAEAQIASRQATLRAQMTGELTEQFVEALKTDFGTDIDRGGIDTAFNIQTY